MHIDREDMLELTRRMTVSRNCFSRIAGAYMDEEGFIDGTFNTHFLKLSGSEKEKNLNIAKTVPYSNTNVNLKNYRLDQGARKPGSIMQLLEALRQCELKNDALLYSLYEYIGERYQPGYPYAVRFKRFGYFAVAHRVGFVGDKAFYFKGYIAAAQLSPVTGDYEAGKPEAGFLYPAFANHSTDIDGINIYQAEEGAQLFAKILGVQA